jgi:hypothetical protein
VEIAKIFLEFAELAGVDIRRCVVDGEGELRLFLSELGFEDLTGAGDGVALVVEEAFNAQSHLNIATAIETLAGAAFVRFELRELALPETKDIGWDIAELGYFADAEVKLIRDVRPGGGCGFTDWLMLRHARNSDTAAPAPAVRGPASGKYRPPNPVWFVIFISVFGRCRRLISAVLLLQDFAGAIVACGRNGTRGPKAAYCFLKMEANDANQPDCGSGDDDCGDDADERLPD